MSPADRARSASATRASVERGDLFYVAERDETPHEHKWSPWSPRFVLGPYEKRYCDCGSFQARRVAEIADALGRVSA